MTRATQRVGDWIQLVSGRPFWPMDPRPEEVEITDIAHALSMQCRFGGHCIKFYSVAEHSLLVSWLAGPELALQGLLHDAAEAYLQDVPRPIKKSLPEYRAAEDRLMNVIAQRFGLSWPFPGIDAYDLGALVIERAHLMVKSERQWDYPPRAIEREWLANHHDLLGLPCFSPAFARDKFLLRFEELGGDRHG